MGHRDAQASPESPGSGSNRDLVSILYRLQYTLPVPLRPGHLKYTNQHSLGGKDTVTACCTMLSPALSVLFGQTAKKRPEGLKLSTSAGQNNWPWSLTQSFWMAGKEKKNVYVSQMSEFIDPLESPIRWLHFLSLSMTPAFPVTWMPIRQYTPFFKRSDCCGPDQMTLTRKYEQFFVSSAINLALI